jgi:hypothetical protein
LSSRMDEESLPGKTPDYVLVRIPTTARCPNGKAEDWKLTFGLPTRGISPLNP